MRRAIASPRRLAQALSGPLLVSGPFPLADRTPDPGLFGPGSVTWRVMREPLLVLGAGRALLMQAAHPLVAQGAIDHSSYASDPWGRLDRTMRWVTAVSFGTTAEARGASRVVNRLHQAVSGTLPRGHATRRLRAGTAYAASEPDLLLWVHASFVETMLAAHDSLIGGLDGSDRDAFIREWDAVARLMRVPIHLLWRDHADLEEYVAATVARGPAMPGGGSRLVAETVLHPPLPSAGFRPLWDVVAFTTVGLLPAQVRRRYGISWTPAHTAAHGSLRLSLRAARATIPRLRTSPVLDFATARVEGRLAERVPPAA